MITRSIIILLIVLIVSCDDNFISKNDEYKIDSLVSLNYFRPSVVDSIISTKTQNEYLIGIKIMSMLLHDEDQDEIVNYINDSLEINLDGFPALVYSYDFKIKNNNSDLDTKDKDIYYKMIVKEYKIKTQFIKGKTVSEYWMKIFLAYSLKLRGLYEESNNILINLINKYPSFFLSYDVLIQNYVYMGSYKEAKYFYELLPWNYDSDRKEYLLKSIESINPIIIDS